LTKTVIYIFADLWKIIKIHRNQMAVFTPCRRWYDKWADTFSIYNNYLYFTNSRMSKLLLIFQIWLLLQQNQISWVVKKLFDKLFLATDIKFTAIKHSF
jgi:hypothetical protein